MADQRQRVERLLDVALYAPVGAALTLRDRLPPKVRQGRQALENRVQLARFVGELAVRYGRAEIERELRERRESGPASANGDTTVGHELIDAAPAHVAPVHTTEPATTEPATTEPAAAEPVPDAESLPIGDYESLAAIHVVQRLGSLRDDEIDQIRQFEATHRARRTVLAKIAQLQETTAP